MPRGSPRRKRRPRSSERRQLEQRLADGPLWSDHGLVLTSARGGPLDANNIRTRSFRRLLARAGLPPMRFHNLRHAAASLLLAQGVNIKVITEVLAHADVTVTLRVYAHLLPSTQDDAAAAMDRLFGLIGVRANGNGRPSLDSGSDGRWFMVETGEN